MKSYINAIIHEILIQSKSNQISIIRVEGLNSPIIYCEICKYFENFLDDTEFIAKLSKEKYDEFFIENRNEWKHSLDLLVLNEFVDLDGAMTAWRNSSSELEKQFNGKKIILLLMGTEVVPDEGGLADFYCINPDLLLKKLKKNYSEWFKDLFNLKGLKSDELKAIHNLFKEIFKNVNVDLIKLSILIDDLSDKILYTTDELIEEICFRLDKDWGIPSIRNIKKVPKVKKLTLNNSTAASIISKAYSFIMRQQYKNGLSKNKMKNIIEKIDEYANNKVDDIKSPFPIEEPLFSSYLEFKEELLSFIVGKNHEIIRNKLMKMDFSTLDEILNFKLHEGETTSKNKANKIVGEPIEIYIKIISKICLKFTSSYKELPKQLKIKVNDIKISNCSTEEEKHNFYKNLCTALGGIIEFINENSFLSNEGVNISYEDVHDPFNISAEKDISITKTANLNELCKISFTVKAFDEDKNAIKQDFIYLFNSKASWIQSFVLLNDDNLLGIDSNYIRLPLYGECKQINEYIFCESDDEFFIKLEKMKLSFEYEEYFNVLCEAFSINEIKNAIGLLIEDFRSFICKLLNEGYYNTITNSGGCNKVFNRYLELLKITKDNYDDLISSQKEKIYLILNLFVISEADIQSFLANSFDSVILPPYNPVILEKIYYQMTFMRNGFDELVSLINNGLVMSDKEIDYRIGYLSKMSIFTSGVDVLTIGKGKFIPTEKMHQYFAIYNMGNFNYNLISEKVFENELVDDDEIDKKNLIKKTHKSDILYKNISDYLKTFPSALDGINILFINPDDMQHVVAGVHDVINKIKESDGRGKINLRIIISDKRQNGADYLKYWLDAFFEDENSIQISAYLNYMNLDSPKIKETIEKYIEKQDIVFMYKVLEDNNIGFQKSDVEALTNQYKYPAIFTPLPISISQNSRGVDISQRQFNCANEHLQLLHKYIMPDATSGCYKVIKDLFISNTNKSLIEQIHKKCKWVICIDEAIDREILNDENSKVIGFSTGMGIFGELNVTISARKDVVEDIKLKLKQKLINKFCKWNTKRVEDAAIHCIEMTKDLDGSRVLKALNPSDYEINNFLAYVLTIQNLHLNVENDKFIIRSLINLDNHRHWFDINLRDTNQESSSRPDFLLLEIENNKDNVTEGTKLKINATIIECKMAFENSGHIEKATNQVIHGINVLANNFDPNAVRVNKRYWFNQLYRALIFSRINLHDNKPEYKIFTDKLAQIYSGNFDFQWNGKIFAYWLNQDDANYSIVDLDYDSDELEVTVNEIKLHTAGQLFIQKLLVPSNERNEEFEFNEIENIDVKDEFIDEIFNDKSDIQFNVEPEIGDNENIGMNQSNKDEKPQKEKNIQKELVIENNKIHQSEEEMTEFSVEDRSEIMQTNDMDFNKEESLKSVDSVNKVINLKDTRFLLGKDIKTNEEVYWEFGHPKLNNRHLLINGNSGSGKTYCIQTLIMEAVKNNISVIVFDYTDGFTETKLDQTLKSFLGNRLKERIVKYEKFPVNPFKRHKVMHGGKEFDELDADIANRIASSFRAVYNFGPQQRNVVYEAVLEGIKNEGSNMNFNIMSDFIYKNKNTSASTVYSKIRPFIDYNPFLIGSEFSWNDIISSNGELHIIQLSGFEREIQVMLTEIILWDIWNYATKFGNEDKPMPLVLDEAHNLSHDSSSPSGRILAEGRKFGISGWYATQFMKGRLDSESIGNLQQAAQKLYFSPPEESMMEVAKYIDISNEGSKEWAEKIKKLTKGKCVTCGFKTRNDKFDKYEPKIINITSLGERLND
jgi:hypothetical protein